jgi:hypothetical protein
VTPDYSDKLSAAYNMIIFDFSGVQNYAEADGFASNCVCIFRLKGPIELSSARRISVIFPMETADLSCD